MKRPPKPYQGPYTGWVRIPDAFGCWHWWPAVTGEEGECELALQLWAPVAISRLVLPAGQLPEERAAA
jgi:hypothetical protein